MVVGLFPGANKNPENSFGMPARDVRRGSTQSDGPHGYTLIGATMVPAFDCVDYKRGMRDR